MPFSRVSWQIGASLWLETLNVGRGSRYLIVGDLQYSLTELKRRGKLPSWLEIYQALIPVVHKRGHITFPGVKNFTIGAACLA